MGDENSMDDESILAPMDSLDEQSLKQEEIEELRKKKDKKPESKARYKSEWNMGVFDMNRYNYWLGVLEMSETRFWAGDDDSLNPLFAVIKMLYYRFRTLMFETKQKEFDRLFILAEELKKKYENTRAYNPMNRIPEELKKAIGEMIKFFMQTKQEMNLGLPVHIDLSREARWKRAVGLE